MTGFVTGPTAARPASKTASRQTKGFPHAGQDFKAAKTAPPDRSAGRALLALALIALILSPASASPLDAAMDKVFTVRSTDSRRPLPRLGLHLGNRCEPSPSPTPMSWVEAEEVRLIDRHGTDLTALVIARDPVRDVAVIALPDPRPRPPGCHPTPSPELSDEVFALGAPLGIEFTLTEGRISTLARQVPTSRSRC